jgi:hypothetical protein
MEARPYPTGKDTHMWPHLCGIMDVCEAVVTDGIKRAPSLRSVTSHSPHLTSKDSQ